MYVNPNIFTFVAHWDEDERRKAASIMATLARRYIALLGYDESSQIAQIGVWKAYRKYGNAFVPKQLNGYVRRELSTASNWQNRNVILAPGKRSFQSILKTPLASITPVSRFPSEEIEFLADLEKILSAEEFDVVRGHIYFEEELVDEREQALYKSALKKMREVLYV